MNDPDPTEEKDNFYHDGNHRWWEKDVEYLFLQDLFQKNELKIAPLAGDPEQLIGDAMIGDDIEYGIVEFKVAFGKVRTEKKKYPSDPTRQHYNRFLDKVQGFYKGSEITDCEPHVLVYGTMDKGYLSTRSIDYWLRDWPEGNVEPDELEVAKLPKDLFLQYAKALARCRKQPSDGELRGGVIFGFSGDTVVSFLDLELLLDELRNTYEHKSSLSFGPG